MAVHQQFWVLRGVAFYFILSLSHAVAAQQSPECLPATPESSSWPVKAIYLHGLFKPEGGPDTNGFRKLERLNRQQLEKVARRLRIRIAVPVAPVAGRFRNWNTTSFKQIEASARAACGNSNLAENRALIGFSNGGYKARAIAFAGCEALRSYAVILAIGAPKNTRSGPCQKPRLVNTAPHQMPELEYFDQNLVNISHLNSDAKVAPAVR